MDDKHELGLRGPVKTVKETAFGPAGEFTQVFTFEPAGGRTDLLQRAVIVTQIEGGGRAETETISGLDYWTMSGLHGTAFPTHGAHLADTRFSSSDRVVCTIFKNDREQMSSRVEYTLDEQGQIVIARQSLPSGPHSPFSLPRAEDSDHEALRVGFSYDAAGRLVGIVDYFAGEVRSTIVQTLNLHGDVELFEASSGETFRFSYDYDEAGNWIRRIARNALGTTETHRVITYYE